MTGEDMEKQLEFEAFVKKHGVPAGPLIRTEIFRRELESMGYPNVSDRELEAYLQPFAKSYVHVDNDLILKWADKLPPEKWRLSLSLKKYIEDGGHVTRAYDVIE